jgi:ElaB/YqjD/DUF883 family membrane-anchored ribosome-binding protein
MAYNTASPAQLAANTAARASETLGNQAHGGIDRVSGTAHQAVDRVASAASSAAERAGVMGQELMTAKDEWVDTARGYVREHPIAALGIAVSVGYLLSRLSGR